MVKPTFLLSKTKGSYPKVYRLIALGIILAAGAILLIGLGFQNSDTAVGRLVRNVGSKVGISLGNTPDRAGSENPPEKAVSGSVDPDQPGAALAVVSSDEILRLINEFRTERGKQPIVKNERFCELANARAKQISTNWSQQTITENQDYYFRAVCLKCKKLAELIARNVSNPHHVLEEWTKDRGNREVLERPGYNIGCVGGFSHDQQTAYIALELGERVE